MKVLLFAASPTSLRRLRALRNRKTIQFEVLPLARLRSTLPGTEAEALVYIDVGGLGERERSRALAAISDFPRLRFGIIDSTGAVKDVAALFHSGAVDYIGKKITPAALTAGRLSVVEDYAPAHDGTAVDGGETDQGDGLTTWVAAESWAGIVAGREYRFAFLFVEADNAEELKKRHEPDNLATAMETFRGYVEGIVTLHGGRLWMWSRFGGLALFPLRDAACPVVLCGLRLMLSQIFYDAEVSLLPGPLSFRMALSIGSTIYHENDTGGIVSDAINSIFHLGRRYAHPGRFVMTEEAAQLAPAQLREHCAAEGTFEGRRILRMLRPRSMSGERDGLIQWEN
jgi:hypothetical protein